MSHGLRQLAELRGSLAAPMRADELVPPPRFADKSFASFIVDPAIAGQAEAVAAVRDFAQTRRPWWRKWLPFSREPKAGLYLDGGFGVGKTHLLAASYAVAPGTRRYLSFSDAISLVVLKGASPAAELIAAELVCIDEFELDDPANTRLADLLLVELVARGCRIVTTSNTVPGELGVGRVFVDQFRDQLARIADTFADVHVPGRDWRRRELREVDTDPPRWGAAVALGADAVSVDAVALHRLLGDVPVVNLRRLALRLPTLAIVDLAPFTDQLAALRFVQLVDRLYDAGCALTVRCAAPLAGLFPEEHCQQAFAKKYRRCLSRLIEMCS